MFKQILRNKSVLTHGKSYDGTISALEELPWPKL
jgi:hypothetical protein